MLLEVLLDEDEDEVDVKLNVEEGPLDALLGNIKADVEETLLVETLDMGSRDSLECRWMYVRLELEEELDAELEAGRREALECRWMYVRLEEDVCDVVEVDEDVGVVVPGTVMIACCDSVNLLVDLGRGKHLTVGSFPMHTPMQQLGVS